MNALQGKFLKITKRFLELVNIIDEIHCSKYIFKLGVTNILIRQVSTLVIIRERQTSWVTYILIYNLYKNMVLDIKTTPVFSNKLIKLLRN